MDLIRGLHNLARLRKQDGSRGCVATIGNFDGVHLGHQAILEQLRERAAAYGLPATVVVFEPQPREFFAGDKAPPRLTRLADKVRLLGSHGAERVLCLPFNETLRSLSAREFIEQVLIDGLGVRHLVVGDDFRFGCDRAGDFALLERIGAAEGFAVEHTRTFEIAGERVSSTRVREVLAAGDMALAARLLGRAHHWQGRVVADRQLGRTLGVPTANLPLPNAPLAVSGVYAVMAHLADGRDCPAVANIGWRPTVGTPRPVLEVHLLDFAEDLYGQPMRVSFCAFLRGEQRFDGLEALKAAIYADIALAKRFFALAAGEAPAGDEQALLDCMTSMADLPLASRPLSALMTDAPTAPLHGTAEVSDSTAREAQASRPHDG